MTLRVSCIVVCYNQERTIADAVLSLIRQTLPPDEIIVADDASTDGSRDVIRTLANSYRTVRPVFRETNLGVSANRDLALREAEGDFVTTLDGDDYVRPTKIQKEREALQRTSSSIAYSVQRFSDELSGTSWLAKLPPMDQLDARERLRWIVSRRTHTPRDMLIPKSMHIGIGGYRHELRVYEDWDYKIRLAAMPGKWANSGVEGVIVRRHGLHEGLSKMPHHRHALAQLRVLNANRTLIHGQLGKAVYFRAMGRILAKATQWQIKDSYSRVRRRIDDIRRSHHAAD